MAGGLGVGVAVASAGPPPSLHYWVAGSYAAAGVMAGGSLIVLAVMYDWSARLPWLYHHKTGGPADHRTRSAAPTIDPLAAHKGRAPARKTRGKEAWLPYSAGLYGLISLGGARTAVTCFCSTIAKDVTGATTAAIDRFHRYGRQTVPFSFYNTRSNRSPAATDT